MFTNTKARMASLNPDTIYFNAACLSSDTKPTTGVANGSKCIEMDTGKTYMFNEEDSEWEELPSSGGGGGGGSSDFSTAQVTVIASDNACAYLPIIYDYSSDYPSSDVGEVITVPVIDSNYSPNTVTVPLYKGKAVLFKDTAFYADNSVEVTGNATYETLSAQYGDGYAIIITGDCTITIG